MENSCRKKYRMSSKKWILASRYSEFRRNPALIPANAGLFHYAGNNPVRYIDPDGREAGELFDSVDLAAKDFALTYNDDSIKKNVEIGAYIREKNGKYYYDTPHEGDVDHVNCYRKSSESDIVALIHTHGAYMLKIKDLGNGLYTSRSLGPSFGDIEGVKKSKLPLYTVTPDGSMYLTEVNLSSATGVTNYVFQPVFPSDPNCPGRKNNINAFDCPDNKTISKNDYEMNWRKK